MRTFGGTASTAHEPTGEAPDSKRPAVHCTAGRSSISPYLAHSWPQ
ncbi:hypothetical protein ABIA39_000132 [Nocardia sp. GAS34]